MIKLKRVLGKGSFSVVYDGEYNGKVCAIKVENRGENNNLDREYKIQRYLLKKDLDKNYVVPIYDYYFDDKRNYLIMKRMYMSLGDVLRRTDIKFDDYSVRNIALKIIETLRFIHNYGICHCDIKPDNIMMSEDYLDIFLIDYGLSRNYKRKKEHVPINEDINPFGTLKYMSVHTNNRISISRRDDLISLGYVLIYLQKKELPWQDINAENKVVEIGKIKKEINLDDLCRNCVNGLKEYMEYCYKLEYDENPDYNKLLSIFTI